VERHRLVSARSFVRLLRADVEATTHPNYRLYSDRVFWMHAAAKLLASPGARAVITFRISHVLAERGLLPIAMLLRARALRRSGAEIHPSAEIGPGLLLQHSSGVVIGGAVRIGRNCRLSQGATLGYSSANGAGQWAQPIIGDDVTIGAHAVVIGGVQVGDGAVIGANSVVTVDVDAGTVVAGVPARMVRSNVGSDRNASD
jgi:serine O-acetyltransferase